MSKRISSAPKTDGDPNWQTIDEKYKNPNSDSLCSEYVGVSREAAEAQSVLDHLLLFFQVHIIYESLYQTNTVLQSILCVKTSPCSFSDLESRNDGIFCHFTAIMRFLHLTNNSMQVSREDPNYDKLLKLGNLHKILNNRYSSLYSPQRSLSIDEQMIGTKCRVSFLQSMPKKPKKFGVKVWALCESLSRT